MVIRFLKYCIYCNKTKIRVVTMPTGKVVFVLRTASNALPITNGSISVVDERGSTVFYEFLTVASSGISRTAVLETPPKDLSLESDEPIKPYSSFTVNVRAEGNYRMQISGVQLFEGTESFLPIELIPLPNGVTSPDDADIIIIRIPEHILRSDVPKVEQGEVPLPVVNIGEGVYIPETITVHLGAPDDASAPNVSVAFTDYIKNVASSEIYPTWPKESLRSNVIAQISLTLNRIYTEWYRSRGYDFDITNSTAFDQAFVYGRNIFEEINVIVDEIFNQYLSRPNSIEPLFASYCNGTTTTCAGLSQWGTVALAENGNNAEDILGFYYGNVLINETDDIRTPEESYPGEPLSAGAFGEDVRILQEQLNRIAVNFPQLPLVTVNSAYDTATVNSVREFQRLFILPITGVTDRATWYRISQIYSSVKRLSELTSEGQRAAYNQQLYPGTPISLSSRGSEVQEVQFYLQRISRFNPIVESPNLDGIFGKGTENAVKSFQRAYGIEPSGIVDEAVWDLLVKTYNGTLSNVDEPQDQITPVPYPDFVISAGASGEYARYIQQLLNVINNVFLTIPELIEDGIFGVATQGAVNEFAKLFGFEQSGTVNEALWSKLNQIYATVFADCIFKSGEGYGNRAFGGVNLNIGSSGENVRYIQERINIINTAIPYIPSLNPDGQYGALTADAVKRLQTVFGLDSDGITGENTWLLANYINTAIQNGCLPATAQKAVLTAALNSDLKESARNIKELMRAHGLSVGSGRLFGLKSRISLARWQAENQITPTGKPNLETIKKLIGGDEPI